MSGHWIFNRAVAPRAVSIGTSALLPHFIGGRLPRGIVRALGNKREWSGTGCPYERERSGTEKDWQRLWT